MDLFQLDFWIADDFSKLGRSHRWFLMNASFAKFEWGTIPFKSRREIDISGDDSSVEQREHSIMDITLRDRRWLTEGIIPEVLR